MMYHHSRNWLSPILVVSALLTGHCAGAHVSIVSDGADGAPAMIRLDGAIIRGDHSAFEAALRQVRDVATATINGVPFITVELSSPGGDVVEALDIGRTIYQNFLMTLVRPGHECVSACVFVLMAGAVHTPADGSSIGLHRPLLVSWSHIDYREARRRYDGLMQYLRQYFRQLGVADSAFDLMMRTDSYGMRYFSQAEMDQLGLRGEDPAWEKFYGAKWALATESKPEARPARLADAGRLTPAAAAPKLAPVDQTLRGVVFMPGAYHPGEDYMAGADVPRLKPEWTPLDNGWQPLWTAVDLGGLARALLSEAASRLAQIWWLVVALALELLRARPWPGDPRPRRDGREQWRLAGLVSPASTRAADQA
jgi:hypothetical protein